MLIKSVHGRKQIGKFVYVLTPRDGQYAMKRTSWKGKIHVIEDNIKKVIKTNKEEMKTNIEEQLGKIKRLLEEQWNKDQDLLHSILERIKALEVETNRLTSSMDHPTT